MEATASVYLDCLRAARTSGSQAFKRQKVFPGQHSSLPPLDALPLDIKNINMSPATPTFPPTMTHSKARRSSPSRINPWVANSSHHLTTQASLDTRTSIEPASASEAEDGEVVAASLRDSQAVFCEGASTPQKGPKTCAQCGSSKTPLWRNGPPGPKSLCNACGIRYNKMKAGKRSRAQMGEESPKAPSSPSPLTPSFRGKGKMTKEGKAAKHCDWKYASLSPTTPSRKRSRHAFSRYGSQELTETGKGEGRADDMSSDEGEEARSGSPTSSGSSNGGSCITRRGRRTTSPAWNSRQAPMTGEVPPLLSLQAEAEPEAKLSVGDDKEGAELLMMLFYGAGTSWMHQAVAA